MASGLVSSLLSSASKLLDILRSPPRSCPPCGEAADLQRLERLLRRVQATLDDAGEREVRDRSVKLWTEELTDLARDSEDILDDCRFELLRRRVQEQQSRDPAASTSRKRKHDEGNEDAGITERIADVTRRFEEISRDRVALQLRPEDGEITAGQDSWWESRTTSHRLDESCVFGRIKEKASIIEWVLSCRQGTGTNFLPIVGMGGIGKTTMAQMVYNDDRVRENFDIRGWVHVPQTFDLARLTIAITESLTRKSWDSMY